MRGALDDMQWNAAGIHEVECVQERYSLGCAGECRELHVECACQKDVMDTE